MTAKIITIGGTAMEAYGPAEYTLARMAARNKVKAQAQGRKLHSIDASEINAAAMAYLYNHSRELLEEAAETVRKSPQLRTLAEREARQRKGNRR